MVFAGLPKPRNQSDSLRILRNRAYEVGYSERRKDPLWVSYRLDRVKNPRALPRPSKFLPDGRSTAAVKTGFFKNTGYDRGHMAPNSAIAVEFGSEAQNETFLLTNICPQKPDLNRKVWANLERFESDCSSRFETVWVMTGPIFDGNVEIMAEGIEIPDAFYKILVDDNGGEFRFLPFMIPQDVDGTEHLGRFLTSVDKIESATGLDFFWALTDPTEERLEAEKPKSLWIGN